MLNRVYDLAGFLNLLWKQEWYDREYERDPDSEIFSSLDNLQKEYARLSIGEDGHPLMAPLHLLNPRWYARFRVDGDLTPLRALDILPTLMRRLSLARSMDSMVQFIDENGEPKTVRIGDEIPEYEVCTVEMQYDEETQRVHDHHYMGWICKLKPQGGGEGGSAQFSSGASHKSQGGRVDFRANRRLCHLSESVHLEDLAIATGKKNLSGDIRQWAAEEDKGVHFFISNTKKDKALLVPTEQISIAYYLASPSPKLSYMSKVVAEVCLLKKERLLVFLEWVMPMWKMIAFLNALGIRWLLIHSGMTHEERAEAARKFNDSRAEVDILVTTYACASQGLNLHHCCSNVVLFEPARNINTEIQAMNRIHRIGQTKKQKIWILFMQHTYDRYRQYTNTSKMVRQIAAERAGEITDAIADEVEDIHFEMTERRIEQIAQTQQARAEGEEIEAQPEDDFVVIDEALNKHKDVLIQKQASMFIQKMFGQASCRLGFSDWTQLGHSHEETVQEQNLDEDMEQAQITVRRKRAKPIKPTSRVSPMKPLKQGKLPFAKKPSGTTGTSEPKTSIGTSAPLLSEPGQASSGPFEYDRQKVDQEFEDTNAPVQRALPKRDQPDDEDEISSDESEESPSSDDEEQEGGADQPPVDTEQKGNSGDPENGIESSMMTTDANKSMENTDGFGSTTPDKTTADENQLPKSPKDTPMESDNVSPAVPDDIESTDAFPNLPPINSAGKEFDIRISSEEGPTTAGQDNPILPGNKADDKEEGDISTRQPTNTPEEDLNSQLPSSNSSAPPEAPPMATLKRPFTAPTLLSPNKRAKHQE